MKMHFLLYLKIEYYLYILDYEIQILFILPDFRDMH